MRKKIHITESKLDRIVKESVKKVLMENVSVEELGEGDYVVANENTLGSIARVNDNYSNGMKSYTINVLAVDYMNGGEPLLLGHQIFRFDKDVRKVRPEDEERFKISL